MYDCPSGWCEVAYQWLQVPEQAFACARTCAQVELPGEQTARPRRFQVQIKWAATVDILALLDFVECAASPLPALAVSPGLAPVRHMHPA
jgi:hypothetical protein